MRRAIVLGVASLVLAGCGGADTSRAAAPEPSDASRTIQVSSPAFADGEPIPSTYTCSGGGASPALDWSGVPTEAQALALVVDDPDASSGTYTHWVVVDIPVGVEGVVEGEAPAAGTELRGSGGRGWSPPCPPSGTHHYRFSVYALRSPLSLPAGASLEDAMAAIGSATVAWGRLTGTVQAASSGGGGY